MDLHRLAASAVVIGFEGTEVPPEAWSLVGQGVAGAILFKRNASGGASQVARLTDALKREAARPFLVCVDQEGGRVARLRGEPFTALPPMREVGARGDEALAFAAGRVLARDVRAVGIDVDFAPVLDVDTNPANPVIGDRSLSRQAGEVARLGVALARGIESEGVASCGKHFPGHGDTSQDSHLTLPCLHHPMERLRAVELAPFAAYARAGLASIMTAHVVFEAVEPGLPATFSRRVLDGILRNELGFRGVIVSDDLEMKAIAERYSLAEAGVRAVAAGADLLLVCHRAQRQQEVIDGLAREAGASSAFRRRLEEAAERVAALARRFASPPQGEAGLLALETAEHRALAAGVAALGAHGRDPTEGAA